VSGDVTYYAYSAWDNASFTSTSVFNVGSSDKPLAVLITPSNGTFTYSSIAEAVAAASSGDTINLTAGATYETDQTLFIRKKLTLNGNDAIIKATDPFNVGVTEAGEGNFVISILNDSSGNGNDTTINDLNVDSNNIRRDSSTRSGSYDEIGGINVVSATGVKINNTEIKSLRGALIVNGAEVTVTDVTTQPYQGAWYGVDVDNGGTLTINKGTKNIGLVADKIQIDDGDVTGTPSGSSTITDNTGKWVLVEDAGPSPAPDTRYPVTFGITATNPGNQVVASGGTANVSITTTVTFTNTASITTINGLTVSYPGGVAQAVPTSGGTVTFTISGLGAGQKNIVFTLYNNGIAVATTTATFNITTQTTGGGGTPSGGGGVIGGGGTPVGGTGSSNPSTPDTKDITDPVTPRDPKPWPVFADVDADDWFYGDVYYVYMNDLMESVNEAGTLFGSDVYLTRGMVVTILGRVYNVAVEKYADAETPYIDVDPTKYYAPYVAWATENDIATGYADDTFRADQLVSRQEMVAFVVRFVDFLKLELPALRDYTPFADEADIHGYAQGYVEDAFSAELINGQLENKFAPLSSALRVEFAAIVHRLVEALGT
jgi:hypothetical protein